MKTGKCIMIGTGIIAADLVNCDIFAFIVKQTMRIAMPSGCLHQYPKRQYAFY